MKQLTTLAAACLGMLLVGAGIGVTTPPAMAQGGANKDVRVINTSAEAIPVRAASALPVDVTSLPAVQVASLPAIQIDPATQIQIQAATTQAMLPEERRTIPAGVPLVWFMDAAAFEKVRVSIRVPDLTNQMTLDLFTGSLNIGHFNLNGRENTSVVIEIPGARFGVMVSNENGLGPQDFILSAYGR